MFAFLDYDISRHLVQTLAPRIRGVVSGRNKPFVNHEALGRHLHPKPFFTLTPARSTEGQNKLVRQASFQTRTKLSQAGRGGGDIPPGGPGAGLPFKEPPTIAEAFRNARRFQDIPGPTAMHQALPFAGTRLLYYPFSNETTEDMGGMLSRLQATYGPIMRVRLGSQWVVFIEHLADIQHAVDACDKELLHHSGQGGGGGGGLSGIPSMTSSSSSLSTPRPLTSLEQLKQPVKDVALLWLDAGARPQKLRNGVGRHLGSGSTLALYLKCQEAIANDLVRQLANCLHSPRGLQSLCHRYAIENSGQLCFNQRIGLLGDHYFADGQRQRLVDSYRSVIRCLGEILTGTRVFYTLFKDPFAKRLRGCRSYVQTWERRQKREVTTKALKEKGTETLVPEDLSMLLTLMDDEDLAEEDISDILHALMTTRSEASFSALLLLLAALATNEDKQERLAQDIALNLGPQGYIQSDSLDKLPYLGACINESLRLNFPMSSGGQIVLSNNIVLSNYLVPAGTPIEVNSRRTAMNPVWFDHAAFYLPERWLGDRADKIPQLAFMPFGFTHHGCPGLRTFFFQEMAAAVIKILQKYRVDLPEEYHHDQLRTVHTPFCTPKECLPFILTPRGASPPPPPP